MGTAKLNITGIVLAGGESRRMGRDKAQLVWQGKTLLDRAVRLLSAYCDRVVIASARPGHTHTSAERIPEPQPGAGPLAGLVAAAGDGWNLVLPVDMPLVSAETLSQLIAEQAGPKGVAFATEGIVQPFPALYGPVALSQARKLLAAGQRSMRSLLRATPVRTIHPLHASEFINFNTPEQWETIQPKV